MATISSTACAILLLLSWARPTAAAEVSINTAKGVSCYDSCNIALWGLQFNDSRPTSPGVPLDCGSAFRTHSQLLCLHTYCAEHDFSPQLEQRNATCHGLLPSLEDVVAEYTDEELATVRRLLPEEAVWGTAMAEVVLPTEELMRIGRDTLASTRYMRIHHLLYSFYVLVFWIGVIIIGQMYRVAHLLHNRALDARRERQRPLADPYASSVIEDVKMHEKPALWLKQYITTPATFGYSCQQNIGWCTVPPRVQSLTILAFILLNTFFCIHGYWIFAGNLYFPPVSKQFWRYLSDRTGFLSFANFPIIWIFGMRNNLLLWLTGWDFATYNNFHRWVARVSTLQAVIHSIGYTVLVFMDGGWAYFMDYMGQVFWWSGEIATVAMCLILGLSVYYIRRTTYEFFLIAHIVLSVIVLATMWGHLTIFHGLFDGVIWVCGFVWVADRFFRVGRLLSFNWRVWNTPALAVYTPDTNMVRLTVPRSKSWYTPKPGTFFYIYVLNSDRFWESHPFTMASANAPPRPMASLPRNSDDDPTDRTGLLTPPSVEYDDDYERRNLDMTFLIRPYDGFTARLRDQAYLKPANLRVLVEGPYGHTQPFHKFDHVLFIAGGSGIAVPLSYLQTLCSPSSRPKSVRILWAVRELSLATDVIQTDFSSLLLSEKLKLDVYLTRGEASWTSTPRVSGWPSSVRAVGGRPDVRDEIEYAVGCAEGASLAVVACGPARMADDARSGVVSVLRAEKGGRRVEYFEESFSW